MANDEQGPTTGKHGVVSRSPYGRTFTRMRSGAVDAGVRSATYDSAPKPKVTPPRVIVQPMAKLDRPSEQWQEEPKDKLGSLPNV